LDRDALDLIGRDTSPPAPWQTEVPPDFADGPVYQEQRQQNEGSRLGSNFFTIFPISDHPWQLRHPVLDKAGLAFIDSVNELVSLSHDRGIRVSDYPTEPSLRHLP